MIRKVVVIAGLVPALVLALVAGIGHAGVTDIFGTAHDLGSSGNPTCRQCHTPHNAEGSYLWARTPKTGVSGLQALCLSCHDGTVTDRGQFIGDPSHVDHPVSRGVPGSDCDRCHDPHVDNWKFVTDSIPDEYRNANLCSACHETGANSHPLTSTALPIDRTWNPYASTPDFGGTRLFNSEGSAVESSGTGDIKCATCHVAHGAAGSTLNSMDYVGDDSHSPLCENCHQ
jgi:predicted CXXCH cytochrome family protein